MKVLLISANTEQINMPVLPLGMACVGAAARRTGHDVKMVNLMMHRGDPLDIVRAEIDGFDPEVIGVSVRNIDDQRMENPQFLLDLVKALVAACKARSAAPVVLGGAGYSIFPRSVLAYVGADMGIRGEGEAAFVRLLERLARSADPTDLPGVYLPGAAPRCSAHQTRDLDQFPIPLPKLHLDIPADAMDQDIFIPFQTRRGCPLNCSYCSTSGIEGRILRKHSLEAAADGLRRYAEAGFTRFFFVDNTFNLPPSYAEALCGRIIKAGLNIDWRCILYPGNVEERLIEKMAEAGCAEVSLGCESGSGRMLKLMNKRFSPEEVRQTAEFLGKYGIRRMGFLLLGGPGETRETVEKSLRFMDGLNLEMVKLTLGVRIYPGTDLHRIAVNEGAIAPDDDLLFPRFYMEERLKGWIEETVAAWMSGRPNWVR